jgi:hypothetical protein
MILGLDISTSITGFTILNLDGQIQEIGHWNFTNKKKFPTLFSKAVEIRQILSELEYPIEYVYIESVAMRYSPGFSRSTVISLLTKFNGIVSWLCYEVFGIEPEYIPATSARKKCGITIKRGTKAKEQVIAFLLDNEPDFSIEYTRTGKPKPYCYDQADSLIIARAGLECLKERLK